MQVSTPTARPHHRPWSPVRTTGNSHLSQNNNQVKPGSHAQFCGRWLSRVAFLVHCSLPKPSAESCAVVKDYLSLINVARNLGPKPGTPPQITIMVPPPLWRDSVYGMNQTILNDIMPSLVPEIAALAKLPPPIDLFTALGALHCVFGCRWLLVAAM